VPVREITADDSDLQISSKPCIIVATAGVEPEAKHGYSAVVFVDCATQLSRDSLRAPEDALRSWLNALAFMKPSGSAVAVGISDEVSKALSLGQVTETVSKMLVEREQLGFPPAKRIVSATGSLEVLNALAEKLVALEGIEILGIAEARGSVAENDHRLIASFSYSVGVAVAKEVRAFLLTMTAKDIRINMKSGRSLRPVTIKFDDPRVL
jgi:primosomal protein N' (replication factor Y)